VLTQFKGPHNNALSLIQEFGKYGPLEKVTIVIDGKSGRSRGFAFIKFQNVEDATQARNALTDTGKDKYSQFLGPSNVGWVPLQFACFQDAVCIPIFTDRTKTTKR
jgi:RNA recognition motif-containing protein